MFLHFLYGLRVRRLFSLPETFLIFFSHIFTLLNIDYKFYERNINDNHDDIFSYGNT